MSVSKIANLRIIKEQHMVMLLMMAMLKDALCHANNEMPYTLVLKQGEKLDRLIDRIEKLLEKEEALINEELVRIEKSVSKGRAMPQN